MPKAVCYFGSYDPNYSRNRIIIKGLRAYKVTVLECQSNGFFISRFFKLTQTFLKLERQIKTIVVGFPGWYDLPLAFILAKIYGKKLIFDVFTPMYETYFLDRKQVRLGFLYLWLDRLNMKLADLVIADTKTHLEFYEEDYGLNSNKGLVVYVGSDDEIFYPRKVKFSTEVLFYGSFQPLQGVEQIVSVAKKLPNVNFKLIGAGQTKKKILEMVFKLKIKNIEFIDWMSLDSLAMEICKAKVILGIFGSSAKALSVIPNKVFDALASKKIVITKRTRAVEELLIDGENAILTDEKMPLDVAITKALRIKNSVIENNAYLLYKRQLRPEMVIRSLVRLIK